MTYKSWLGSYLRYFYFSNQISMNALLTWQTVQMEHIVLTRGVVTNVYVVLIVTEAAVDTVSAQSTYIF